MLAAAQGVGCTIPYGRRCELQYAPDIAAAFVAAARASFTCATVVNVPGSSVLIDDIVAEIERAVPEVAVKIEFGGPSQRRRPRLRR